MIYLIWVVSVFILSCGVTGVWLAVDDIVKHWSHAKQTVETVERDTLPNYWHISHLEFELFGVTFHNPDPAPYCGSCRCAACRYRVDPVNVHAAELYVNGLPEWQDREGE